MATKVTRPAGSWSYVLKMDRELPPERERERSTFVLSPLTQGERAIIIDEIARVSTSADGTTTITSRTNRQGLEIALGHIVSVENFPCDQPQPWPERRADREKYLEQLPDAAVQEIANEIWHQSTVGETVKNS